MMILYFGKYHITHVTTLKAVFAERKNRTLQFFNITIRRERGIIQLNTKLTFLHFKYSSLYQGLIASTTGKT